MREPAIKMNKDPFVHEKAEKKKIKIGLFPPSPSSLAMKKICTGVLGAAIVSAWPWRLLEEGRLYTTLPKAPLQERGVLALPGSLQAPCSGEGAGGSGGCE